MANQRKHWSEWEDHRLVDLMIGQRLPIKEIARLLNRTEGAVKARSERLKSEKQAKRDSTK